MENASKALMIAGGILLAILTLSLVVYMMTAVTSMGDAQDAKALAEQITAFNKEYESYNKRIMYGTDVITVINKAINHNQKISAIEGDPYYINIIIEPIQTFETTVIERDNTKDKNNTQEIDPTSIGEAKNGKLEAGIEYYLGNWKNGELFMNKGIVDFFTDNKSDFTRNSADEKYTYYIYSALTNFKRAIFTCPEDGVKYNEETGRIEEMKFIQTKTATY